MATIGNAPVFPTESVLPGNLEVTGNATISGSSATVNGDEVRTVGTSGAILQVVQATTTTQVTVTTQTYTDTTLTASITPSSSSNKILVMIDQQFKSSRGVISHGIGVRILRDSTVIWTPIENSNGPYSWYIDQVAVAYQHIQHSVLDSPSTTSSVTYKTQGRPHLTTNSGQAIFQLSSGTANGMSTITLMEVVA